MALQQKLAEVSYKRFKDRMTFDEYQDLLKFDPTAPDYKFAEWMLNNFLKMLKANPKWQFIPTKVGETVKKNLEYYLSLPPKQRVENFTYRFKTIDDFNTWVHEHKVSTGGYDYRGRVITVPKEEYKIRFETDEWFLVEVFSHKASIFWGRPDQCAVYPNDPNPEPIFCTTYESPANWNTFWKPNLHPRVMYLKLKNTPEIWAFVKNDETNQYQDNQNQNSEGNSVEDLFLAGRLDDDIYEYLIASFPPTQKYTLHPYVTFDDSQDFEGEVNPGVEVVLNSGDDYEKNVASYSGTYRVFLIGGPTYGDEGMLGIMEKKLKGVFNVRDGRGVVIDCIKSYAEALEEAENKHPVSDEVANIGEPDLYDTEFKGWLKDAGYDEAEYIILINGIDLIRGTSYGYFDGNFFSVIGASARGNRSKVNFLNLVRDHRMAKDNSVRQSNLDYIKHQNMQIFSYNYDYTPKEWTTTDWQRAKDRQIDLFDV